MFLLLVACKIVDLALDVTPLLIVALEVNLTNRGVTEVERVFQKFVITFDDESALIL
jgi:hypothetical protein